MPFSMPVADLMCHYAECIMKSVVMLSDIVLSVDKLSVVALFSIPVA